MSAAIYARVSTGKQKDKISLDQQIERGLAYCEGLGLPVVVVFREAAVSGGKPLSKRPCGAELQELIRQGVITDVIAWDGSRLFRDTVDNLNTARAWDKKGVAVHLVNEGGRQECRSATEKTMRSIKAVFNEHQRLVIGENTRAALRHKREHLEPYCREVYGFDRQGDSLVPNKAEQKIIRKIQRLYESGTSTYAIANRLTADKVPCKRGGVRWYPSTVRALLLSELHAA